MAKSASWMTKNELIDDRDKLLKRIKELEAEHDCRKMDFDQFRQWAASQFMADLCSGKTPYDAMWIILNQAAMNEVWGGKSNVTQV